MFKGIKSIIKLFFLALITVGIGIVAIKLNYDKTLDTPNSEQTEKIEFTITEGETVEQIINKLVELDLLKDKWSYYVKYYIRAEELTNSIQAGIYEIPMDLNIKELINTLQTGMNAAQWITLPEGLRKDEIAGRLEKELNSHFSSIDFLALTNDSTYISGLGLPAEVKDLEGYIFPDRYAFDETATANEVLTIMVENFKKKVGTKDSYDDIIIASLVEREGYDLTDRPVIAGIITKRNEEGWKLGLDVTILYHLKTWDEGEITVQDLADNNPYNTRVVVGLPPTPISNPGLESINAMRNPIKTDYYYFLRGNDSITHYGITYQDHLVNIEKYLR